MLADLKVLRAIPEQCVAGLKTGSLVLKPGAIYQKGGGIAAHFITASPDAMEQVGFQLLQAGSNEFLKSAANTMIALARISVGLSALNVAVTAAGFVVVCKKLNEIRAQLQQMDAKLEQLLSAQARSEWHHELERQARLEAAMENLAIGLRTQRQGLTDNGIAMLGESGAIYRRLCTDALKDERQAYHMGEVLDQMSRMAAACSCVRAQAFGHLGHCDEAVRVLEQFLAWQQEMRCRLERPLESKPIWVGRLGPSQRNTMQKLVAAQRSVPAGLEYSLHQYQLCQEHGIGLTKLADLTTKEPVVFLVPAAA